MGTLFVVATPIGNSQDITLRALEVLSKADLIICEDTRHTGQLLHNYNINKPLLSFHEHNEIARTGEIIQKLELGENIALVSDAGTPLISDPGFKLVRACQEKGIEVKAVPGPSAAIAAMSISGLPTDKFLFVGYLPKTSGKREKLLKELAEIKNLLPMSVIFYESPHRIGKLLAELAKTFPESKVSVARELTKVHEEVVSGEASEVANSLKSLKGEFTVILN